MPFGPEYRAKVEAINAALMKELGAKAGTQNIDRILRLPGTINHPNAVKRRAGRVPCMATQLWFKDERVYELDDFEALVEQGSPDDGGQHARQEVELDIDTLPISERMRNLIKGIDHPDHPYPTRSHRMFAVLVAMAAAGCLDDEMRAVMRGSIGDHIRDQKNPETYLTKQIADARPSSSSPSQHLSNGTPTALFYKARSV